MNKIELINNNKKNIDWSKTQYLIYQPIFGVPTFGTSTIVLTNGNHDEKNFEGFVLPCTAYPFGQYSRTWVKEHFELFEGEAILRISNN